MRRYPNPSPRSIAYSFGPGPMSPAVKVLLWANILLYVVGLIEPQIVFLFGLSPFAVVKAYRVWQPVTYMFLHMGVGHILFNMLTLWMFGVELERLWGTRFFVKFYFVSGVGAGLTTILLSLLPFGFTAPLFYTTTVGASGAIFGLLLAYGLYFRDRPIYMYFVFPIPAKYFVMIIGAMNLLFGVTSTGGGVANFAHLGGMLFGYLYLKGGGGRPLAELKYRYFKWKMNRLRRRFDVHPGGRANGRVH